MCRRDLQQLLGAATREATPCRIGERRDDIEEAVATGGAVLPGSTSEIVWVWSVGVALEPDDAQTVILEDPQRQEVGRPLDEHDVAGHRPQGEDQIERTRTAGGD